MTFTVFQITIAKSLEMQSMQWSLIQSSDETNIYRCFLIHKHTFISVTLNKVTAVVESINLYTTFRHDYVHVYTINSFKGKESTAALSLLWKPYIDNCIQEYIQKNLETDQ